MAKPWKVVLTLGAVAMLLMVVAVAALLAAAWSGARVPRHTLLEVDFAAPLLEQVPDGPLATLLFDKRMRLREVVEALHAAAADPKVVGLVARVAPQGVGLATIEELREAVAAFRRSGKPAVAWADTFGEVTPANAAYYLASAFDEVYIQPSGDVGLTGITVTSLFLRGSLDKLGITPQFAQRYQYKNAPNTFTEKEYTPAHREAEDALAGTLYEQMLGEIARARRIPLAQLRAIVDRGPLLGPEALRAHLVDGLLYRDEVYARARRRAGERGRRGAGATLGGEPRLLFLRQYWEHADHLWARGGPTIALVYGVGDVTRGKSDYDPLGGSVILGGDSVAAALRAAVADDDVKAIVLRVDSPGGSYVASDTIWREVVRARQKGKPVIASFGDLAASGGYFLAMAADRIVAQPSTLTGSIGVFGGKFVTTGLWEKLGVSFDSVQRGAHADMWSGVQPFDADEWSQFNGWLDRVYTDFTTKAAAGRHLPLAKVQEIARGRVWAGVDARRLGLVDALGGYDEALRLAREAAHLAPNAKVELREYPRPRSAFERLFSGGRENSEEEGAQALAQALMALQPALRLLRDAGALGPQPPQALRAPLPSVR
jgi:protease-4